jgi:hypothetical protein
MSGRTANGTAPTDCRQIGLLADYQNNCCGTVTSLRANMYPVINSHNSSPCFKFDIENADQNGIK